MPATRFRHGDVVLVPFPFSNLSGQKVRPALVISADPQTQELILAFITSVLTNRSLRGAEVEMLRSNAEFSASGLKVDSVVRLDKLVTLNSVLLLRRLGMIGPATKLSVQTALRAALGL